MFNWIPTIGEVISKIECTLSNHDWKYFVVKENCNLDGKRYRVCQNCRKSEWV